MCPVSDLVETVCGCQHREYDISTTPACFEAGPRLRVAGIFRKFTYVLMEPIEDMGGKR